MGWWFLLAGLGVRLQEIVHVLEKCWVSNVHSQALWPPNHCCWPRTTWDSHGSPIPSFWRFLLKMLSIQRLSILPGPGGGHRCAAPLGYCGGRWVSPAQSRQPWNEDGMGAGRCSAPENPTPALPLRPEYLRPPQTVFACSPGLSSGAPSSGKSSRTPGLSVVPFLPPIPPVGPHSP